MSNNLKEIKTTLVGALLFVIGVSITLFEYFTVQVVEWMHYALPIGFLTGGIGFLFAPDRLIDFLFSWAKKKTGV
jgi:hypothetical protein